MNVARHAVDFEHVCTLAQEFSEDIPSGLARAREHPQTLGQLHGTARTWAATTAVATPDSVVIRQAAALAAEAAAALLALASHAPGETLPVTLSGEEHRLPCSGPTSTTHAGCWLNGVRAAVVAMDRRALDVLVGVPTQVVRASSTRGDEFVYLQVDTWRALVTGEPQTAKLLLTALDAADPDKVQLASPDYVLDQAVPELEVMGRLLQRDAEAFNAALEKALKLHKTYWGKGKRAGDPDGFIAWGLTALARLAQDIGITVTVTSDYVPAVLLRAISSLD